MQRIRALIIIALLLVSPTVTSANTNESVLHPNIVRAMNESSDGSEIEFIIQYRPTLREEHIDTAKEIGIDIVSIFEFIDGFYAKGNSEQIKILSRQDDVYWIEHNSQMEYYMQDTTRVVNAVEAWRTVIIDENEQQKKTSNYVSQTNDGKILLRKALANFIPKSYTEGKKQGFSAPDASWFKGESIDYVKDTLLNKNANIYQFLNPKMVSSLLDEHFSGKKNRRLLIWSLLSFEKWNQCFK